MINNDEIITLFRWDLRNRMLWAFGYGFGSGILAAFIGSSIIVSYFGIK